MSRWHEEWAFAQATRSWGAGRVLQVRCRYLDQRLLSYIQRGRLADEARVSARHALRCDAHLVEDGFMVPAVPSPEGLPSPVFRMLVPADCGSAQGKDSLDRTPDSGVRSTGHGVRSTGHTESAYIDSDLTQIDIHKQRAREDLFAAFWSAYPRQPGESPERAREQWRALLGSGVDPLQLIEAAKRYAEHLRSRPGSWAKHAANWLAQGCFRDLVPAQSAPAAPPAPALTAPSDQAVIAPHVPPLLAKRWLAARAQLHRSLGDAQFRSWIAKLELIAASGGGFTVGAPNAFMRDQITVRYADQIERLLQAKLAISIVHPDERRSPANRPKLRLVI